MVMGPYGPMPAPQQNNGPVFPMPTPESDTIINATPSIQDSEPPLQGAVEPDATEILPALPHQPHHKHGRHKRSHHPHHGESGCPHGGCGGGQVFPDWDIGHDEGHHGHGHHKRHRRHWHGHHDGDCCEHGGCDHGHHGHHGGCCDPCGFDHGCCEEFPKGKCTVQVMGGWYSNCSVFGGKSSQQDYVFSPVNLRFGKLCCFPDCHGCLRGSFEPIFELNGAAINDGPGDFFTGAALILRYNFVQPCCRLVPYVQVGAGAQYNDAYKDETQTALGQALTYTFSGQVGVRWFVKPWLSLDVEGGYIHLTNFGQSSRDDGINALGGSVGMTCYFPKCRSRHY
jgi:hypothetical protein